MRILSPLVLSLALQGGVFVPSAIAAPRFIVSAVNADARLASDKASDANRKPVRTLEFFKIQRGQTVLDVFSGGGYTTELLARAVGPTGTVTAYSPAVYKTFAAKALAERDYAKRLPNVTELWAETNDVDFGENKYDRIMIVQAYHDLYLPDGKDWPKIDAEKFRQKLYKALKPGGLIGVIDHVANTGAPKTETAEKLHRIDPKIIILEMESSGFKHQAFGGYLRNTADMHDLSVFDPKVRGKTDQVTLRFGKPKK
jgi:predicted methyltransferase